MHSNETDDKATAALRQGEEMFELLRPVLEAISGAQAVEEAKAMAQDLELFIATPRTWWARMEDTLAKGMAKTGASICARLAPHLIRLAEAYAEMEAIWIRAEQELVSATPGAQPLLDEIIAAAAAVGAPEVLAVLGDLGEVNSIFDVNAGLPALAHAASCEDSQRTTIPFEQLCISIAAYLSHAAERFYRPLLAGALRVSRLHAGKAAVAPTELGKTIIECRDLWARRFPNLLPLADDRFRILRNSEAHKTTEIDPRNNTVTFVNTRRDGSKESLGPLGCDDLPDLISAFNDVAFGISAAFRVAKRSIRREGIVALQRNVPEGLSGK